MSEESEKQTKIEVSISNAFCVDCDEDFWGPYDDAVVWLTEHREETGHRG